MARPTLFTHRKLLKLAQRLQSKSMAVGTLEMLWHVANETGNPVIGDGDDIETITDWRGQRGELVAALMDCGSNGGPGFILRLDDGRYEIHDFWHHAPDYVRKRAKREIDRQETGNKLHESDRSKRRPHPSSDQSLTGHRPVTDQSLTGQNAVGSLKNGHFGRTPAPAPAPAPAQSEGDARGNKPKAKKAPPKSPPRKRCPDDFSVTPEMHEWAKANAPDVDVDRETAKFCDHEFKTARSDWPATWRNWMRTAQESASAKPSASRGGLAQFAERDILAKLKDRRAALGNGLGFSMADFRDPQPGETSAAYRAAQDAEFERRRSDASANRSKVSMQQVAGSVLKLVPKE